MCGVFGVSCLVCNNADIESYIAYETPNTKHRTLDKFVIPTLKPARPCDINAKKAVLF
jgi:hypothetical protein